jgi:hypothetical protein
MFIRKVFDGVAALQYVLKGQFSLFLSVLKAHRDFYRSLSIVKEKRRNAVALATKAQHGEISPFSIVVRYFARNQKTFRQLGFIDTE